MCFITAMKKLFILISLLSPLLLAALEVTILHTADTHGRLAAATEIKAIFERECDTNTIIIDCGDTVQGTYESALDRGPASIDAMNALNYNVWVLGNHDLDFGKAAFSSYAERFDGDILAANWLIDGTNLPAWTMFEFENIKIAVIGMARDDQLHRGYYPDFSLETTTERETLAKTVKQVKDSGADIIVLARHAGMFERAMPLRDATGAFPEIDLVLGGHTHQDEPGITFGGVFYAQAGKHAENLGVIKIDIDDSARKIRQIYGKLVPLPTANHRHRPIPPYIAELNEDIVIDERKSTMNPLAAIPAEAMRAVTGADAAIHLSNAKSMRFSRFVDERGLFALMPFEDQVVTLKVSNSELRSILAECLSLYRNKGVSLYVSGLSVTADKDGKIVQITPQKQQYKVAMSSFTAVGRNGTLNGLAEISAGRINAVALPSMRDALRYYLPQATPHITEWLRQK